VTQTMPLAIYSRFGAGDMATTLLLSVVLLVASLAVLLGVRVVGGRVRDGI
jgi:ABC-type sulfate transport system permease component